MKDIINNLRKYFTWKNQLTIGTNFISSKDVDEEQVMNSKNNNIEFMTYNNANDIADELFEYPFSKNQIGSETSMTERKQSYI